ncbi:hypothetical protein U1Q18_028265 [Sarracenia purpurea var. burkii]
MIGVYEIAFQLLKIMLRHVTNVGILYGDAGEILLFPVSVKTEGGEKLELQLSHGDSVMDARQFLLDAPETCFFTYYDLLQHAKDGSVHQLEDYNEISEVADITTGDCYLEMVAGMLVLHCLVAFASDVQIICPRWG